MSDAPEITFDVAPLRDGTTQVVYAKIDDVTVFASPLDLQDAAARSLYANQLQEHLPGADVPAVIARLEELAAHPPGPPARRRPSGRDELVELTGDVRLFHEGTNAYASVPVTANGPVHREHHPVQGREFRLWLTRRFYEVHRRPPKEEAIKEVLALLGARAVFDGPELPVATRLAGHLGDVYLDLCNQQWEAVRISALGWEVTSDPPVRFVRRIGMQPLPRPIAGGSIQQLRRLTNLGDDASWCLAVSWLVGCVRPSGPYPILAVNGEQGSAKSTTCRMLRRLIDPNVADLRSVPREERELLIAATNAWVVGFDNLSRVNPHLSDALCRLATGSGLGVRELYTNDEQRIFSTARPILFNGIEELATRPDLLDRCITINLPSIPAAHRVSESDLWQRYEEARPQILGALLDAVSVALRNRSTVQLAERPRMADFAEWIVAAEPALPWPGGAFLREYAASRDAAVDVELEASAIGSLVIDLVHEEGDWDGTSSELLISLARKADEGMRHRVDFPRSPYALSNALRRLLPVLRQRGVVVEFERRGKNRDRIVRLQRAEDVREEPSASSAPPAQPQPGLCPTQLNFEAADGADEADAMAQASVGLDALRTEGLQLSRILNYPRIEVDGFDGATVESGAQSWQAFARAAAENVFVEVYEELLRMSSTAPSSGAGESDGA